MHTTHHTGSLQVGGRLLRGCEMKLSQLRNQPPIGFLWKGS